MPRGCEGLDLRSAPPSNLRDSNVTPLSAGKAKPRKNATRTSNCARRRFARASARRHASVPNNGRSPTVVGQASRKRENPNHMIVARARCDRMARLGSIRRDGAKRVSSKGTRRPQSASALSGQTTPQPWNWRCLGCETTARPAAGSAVLLKRNSSLSLSTLLQRGWMPEWVGRNSYGETAYFREALPLREESRTHALVSLKREKWGASSMRM